MSEPEDLNIELRALVTWERINTEMTEMLMGWGNALIEECNHDREAFQGAVWALAEYLRTVAAQLEGDADSLGEQEPG